MNVSGKEKDTNKTHGFDADWLYYVFEYVYDVTAEEYTPYEGDMIDIVKASNSMEAVNNAGFDDFNKYGAKIIENLDVYKDAIKEERKILSKLNKKIDEQIAERDKKQKEYLEERKCPNCDIKMDKAFRCSKCGYGHECKELLKSINKAIKEEKKAGRDTSNLEDIKKEIQEEINRQNNVAKGK